MKEESWLVYRLTPPRWLKWLGLRHFDSVKRTGTHRMNWGELAYGLHIRDVAFGLTLSERGYSLNLTLPFLFQVYLYLNFLGKRQPVDLFERWGFYTFEHFSSIHFSWGSRTWYWAFPWANWAQVSSEWLAKDKTWVGKKDEFWSVYTEVHPYFYMLDNGHVQKTTAACRVGRAMWKLRYLPFIRMVRYSIDVTFNNEVGERAGSWKGGCIGCSYELKPGESIEQCLRRMQRERRFK